MGSEVDSTAVLDRTVSVGSAATVTVNVARMEGSSKQGNTRRAYVGASLVAATVLQSTKNNN